MKQGDMERMFGGPVTFGPSRRIGAGWSFRARSRNLWCDHCARVFPNGVYRDLSGIRSCPYADCTASESDAQAWAVIRLARPNYPEHPTLGVRYPLQDLVRP